MLYARVDFLDSFGRTRRCLRKDLPIYQQQDSQLTAKKYTNFVRPIEDQSQIQESAIGNSAEDDARQERRKLWEQEEEENTKKSKLHYQDILYQGMDILLLFCRTFYYSFWTLSYLDSRGRGMMH